MVFIDRIYGKLKGNILCRALVFFSIATGIYFRLDMAFYYLLILLNILTAMDIMLKMKSKYHSVQAFLFDMGTLAAGLAVTAFIAFFASPYSAAALGLAGMFLYFLLLYFD
ncbi:MAG: hypothetical protein HYX24_05715 [Candidatus Aenigmarchaeota archaeon]|nr:hypothetical protein [Candidatus Aenigmarchaeota archaeon]